MMSEKRDHLLGGHLARFFLELSSLKESDAAHFEALVILLAAGLEEGHSCIEVSDEERELLQQSGLVSDGLQSPLVLYDRMLYLQRYYYYESRLAQQIAELAVKDDNGIDCNRSLELIFGCQGNDIDLQRDAALLAMKKSFCIISGGPGTGKTTTIVRILAVLQETAGSEIKIGLVAPTGKAAMRLRQALSRSLAGLSVPERIKTAIPEETATIHRLLGVRRHSPQFIHNHRNPLECDVVVVDEASMVDLALMSKLVDALKPGAKLILLGDKDQLTSVESGAVLSELISCLPDNTVILQKSYRFEVGIKMLAEAVNRGDDDVAWALLVDDDVESVSVLHSSLLGYICARYSGYLETIRTLPREQYQDIFQTLDSFRVLCATRSGDSGVAAINNGVEQHFGVAGRAQQQWYPGRPVLIMKNDYSVELYNGDIGICLPDPDDAGKLKVWFQGPDEKLRCYLPYRLPEHQTAFAMTIHKSQGSEFDEVLVVLPPADSAVLSRELVYTAITRAKKKVTLASRQEIFTLALSRKTRRRSGLAALLDDCLNLKKPGLARNSHQESFSQIETQAVKL